MTHYLHHGRDPLLERIFELVEEEDMARLLVRLIESRVKAEKHKIELMEHKLETYEIARDMVRAGGRRRR